MFLKYDIFLCESRQFLQNYSEHKQRKIEDHFTLAKHIYLYKVI